MFVHHIPKFIRDSELYLSHTTSKIPHEKPQQIQAVQPDRTDTFDLCVSKLRASA